MQHGYTYADTLAASQRINWRVEDIIGGNRQLDFDKPFLPDALARTEAVSFLGEDEKLLLNQIRGNGYLYIFGLVEEFILPFVVDHARPRLAGDDARTRAFLQFASEEAKHIDLFKRFRREFEAGFGTHCEVIGPPETIAKAVLAHHPLSVALLILHIEWMTQKHYLECVKDNAAIDPQFASLLKHHWMEESQHAKLDTMMVEDLAAGMTAAEIAKAVDGYLEIGGMIDGGLKQQVVFDLQALAQAIGRVFTAVERDQLTTQQHQAQRWTFIGSGMGHPNFLATLDGLHPDSRKRLVEIVPAFC
ncbi:MAG: hypothetical protein ACREDZ_11370 [Kiloniellales bacterium]